MEVAGHEGLFVLGLDCLLEVKRGLMGELFLHAFQDISQVSIADVLKIRLVVDIEELQFVSDNADADDDPSTAALTTAFRCDGKAHLAGATI